MVRIVLSVVRYTCGGSMRTGNLIVFGPGFRQVWKFTFDAVPVLVLATTLTVSAIVMSTVGYFAPLLADGNNEQSSRLLVENGTLMIENRAAQAQLQELAERARKLEEVSTRIEADLAE